MADISRIILPDNSEYEIKDAKAREKLPEPPTTDGQYVLSVTVSSEIPTYEWIVQSGGGGSGIQTANYNMNQNVGSSMTINTAQYTYRDVEDT